MAKRTLWRVMIVKLRMWYADIRGHHGHKWNYEPSDNYMAENESRAALAQLVEQLICNQ